MAKRNLHPNSHDVQYERYKTYWFTKRQKQMKQPFLSSVPLDGPPSCSLSDFKAPCLRQCPFDLQTLYIVDVVNQDPSESDGGLDGYNWKVRFGNNSDLFVLKVFWDTKPPDYQPYYFAAQRECQNAALFQMMQAAVTSPEYADMGPILINPNPETEAAVEANLFAFSSERRLRQKMKRMNLSSVSSSTSAPSTSSSSSSSSAKPKTEVTTVPRTRKCYGWLKFTWDELDRLVPGHLFPSCIDIRYVGERRFDRPEPESGTTDNTPCHFHGIVYEFIEDGPNDPDLVKDTCLFFWSLGFSLSVTRAANWKSGVLIDHSDAVHTRGAGWHYRHWSREPRQYSRGLSE